MSKQALSAAINKLIREIEIQQQRKLGLKMRSSTGLTVQQASTLQLISERPGLIQKDLVDIFHRRAATVSTLLKNLEANDFITREIPADNSRNKLMRLTDKGQKAVTVFKSARHDAETSLVRNLNLTEQEDLQTLLEKVQNGFSEA